MPNGQYWCEEINYDGKENYWGREVKLGFVHPSDGYIIMVYDSSARQVFFYNMKERRFDNIDTSLFTNVDRVYAKNARLEAIPNAIIVGNNMWSDSSKIAYFWADGKRLSIGDLEYFIDVKKLTKNYTVLRCKNFVDLGEHMQPEKEICWLENEQSFILDEDGSPLTFVGYDLPNNDGADDFIFFRKSFNGSLDYYDNSKYKYVIYSTKLQSYFINPETGSNVFQLGYAGYYNKYEDKIRVYGDGVAAGNIHEQQPSAIFKPEELIEQGYIRKAVKPGSAPIRVVEKEQTLNNEVGALAEGAEFDVNDIRQMVLEAVNKIKNEK